MRGLNDDYIHADQHGDVARYEEFLDLIARPRPFTSLTLQEVTVRIVGDVAPLHGRVTYTTTHDGEEREARYTDTYQRRDGRWLCIAGEVVARGE